MAVVSATAFFIFSFNSFAEENKTSNQTETENIQLDKPQIQTGTIQEEVSKVYRIEKIEIKGLKFFNEEIIKPLIPFGKGAIVSRDKIENTLRDLYKLGYFSNVEAYTKYTENGIDITFVFTELPVVQRIEFEGNKAISKDDLIKELGLDLSEKLESGKPLPFTTLGPELTSKLSSIKKGLGRVLSTDEIGQMIKKLQSLYEKRGYYNTKISYFYKGNTLVFKIDEGSKAYVEKIEIIGNKNIKKKEILSVMETSERSILKLKLHPSLVKETLYEDIDRIRNLYIGKGFFDVDIQEPEVKLIDGKKYHITIKINEGDRYKVDSIKLENNDLYTTKELLEVSKRKAIKSGEYYDQEKIDFIKKNILDKYNDLGYIFANVEVNKLVNKEKKTVDVVFDINKGNIFYVDKINIEGNYESRDATIRRELKLAPGDLFKKENLLRSQSRLYRLGYYDMIGFDPNVKSDNEMDLTTQVSERFTGQMSIGAGYSQQTGLSFFASLKKGNFLGTGDTAGISLSIGSKYRNNSLNYLHRWFLYKPLDLGMNLYDTYVDYTSFVATKTGFSPTISYEFKEYWRTGLTLTAEKGEYKDILDTASTYIKKQAGKYDLYSAGWFINRNTIDNPLLPTSGSDLTLTLKAGTGTRDFYKVVLSGTKLIPDRIFYTDFVFSIKGTFGLVEKISKSIPLDELFFVGGDFTIRGFDWGRAGPLDENKDPAGAKREIVLNYQLAHPIVERFLWGFVFLDQGKGFDKGNPFSNMYNSVGAGLKIITPFAPIELYYGKVLNPPTGTSSSRFGFILGTFF
ncbi:outer membrane protein assembly factor BamA [Sulfurihydrogenibium subterraneum]|uniref:outer membrane protein assembly factor BamA n=1 Tax=Sulfurihydrogenibium subterraneum TaxID=171121 RepID=UPI00048CF7F8|nr:outer membrane protein assembly factor BamA [Sulfurihydrogenibium subterraneum]